MYVLRLVVVKVLMLCSFAAIYAVSIEKTPTYEVVQIASLIEGREKIKAYTSNALCLIDLDNTAIMPVDCVLRDANMQAQKKFIECVYLQSDKNNLMNSIFKNMRWRLVENVLSEILTDLKKNSTAVYGFTARNIGKMEWQSFDGVICEDDCEQSEIVFSSSFERPFFEDDTHEDYTARSLKDVGIALDQGDEIELMRFKHGILFCDPLTKGAALKELLEKMTIPFNAIIMLDDRGYNIESVCQAIREWNAEHGTAISFLGVHYTAVEHMDNAINKKVVQKQLDHLLEHKEYISEEEAVHII